ncbi:hypothetical protein BLNAU_1026 [Blattamonas nauphoetae]|uniref:Uncharacterized protein n=1 Tax=Blattamonas nauphoetae TaxID=2049346 RepID=A0ABQ9YK50_9EUKA|nr:hypothetical protein BLNAU_1026 [Blattamonas nauphoetae]
MKRKTVRLEKNSITRETFSTLHHIRWGAHLVCPTGSSPTQQCSPSTLSPLFLRFLDLPRSYADPSKADSEGSKEVVAQFMAVLDPCSIATHTLSLPSASPLTPPGVTRAGGCRWEPGPTEVTVAFDGQSC